MPWWEQNIGMGGALSAKQQTSADSRTESLQPLSDERRDFIQKSLDAWCANLGYKDSTVNMLTLSRTLCISKDDEYRQAQVGYGSESSRQGRSCTETSGKYK